MPIVELWVNKKKKRRLPGMWGEQSRESALKKYQLDGWGEPKSQRYTNWRPNTNGWGGTKGARLYQLTGGVGGNTARRSCCYCAWDMPKSQNRITH